MLGPPNATLQVPLRYGLPCLLAEVAMDMLLLLSHHHRHNESASASAAQSVSCQPPSPPPPLGGRSLLLVRLAVLLVADLLLPACVLLALERGWRHTAAAAQHAEQGTCAADIITPAGGKKHACAAVDEQSMDAPAWLPKLKVQAANSVRTSTDAGGASSSRSSSRSNSRSNSRNSNSNGSARTSFEAFRTDWASSSAGGGAGGGGSVATPRRTSRQAASPATPGLPAASTTALQSTAVPATPALAEAGAATTEQRVAGVLAAALPGAAAAAQRLRTGCSMSQVGAAPSRGFVKAAPSSTCCSTCLPHVLRVPKAHMHNLPNALPPFDGRLAACCCLHIDPQVLAALHAQQQNAHTSGRSMRKAAALYKAACPNLRRRVLTVKVSIRGEGREGGSALVPAAPMLWLVVPLLCFCRGCALHAPRPQAWQ